MLAARRARQPIGHSVVDEVRPRRDGREQPAAPDGGVEFARAEARFGKRRRYRRASRGKLREYSFILRALLVGEGQIFLERPPLVLVDGDFGRGRAGVGGEYQQRCIPPATRQESAMALNFVSWSSVRETRIIGAFAPSTTPADFA